MLRTPLRLHCHCCVLDGRTLGLPHGPLGIELCQRDSHSYQRDQLLDLRDPRQARYWGVHTINEAWEKMLWVILALRQ